MISGKSVYDLVFLALREIGVVSLGDSIVDDVAQEALLVLNSLRAEWSINTKNYTLFDQTYQATTNTSNITLGAGGNITTRPHNITQITIINGVPGTGINYNISIEPYENYRQLAITNVFAIPRKAYIDNMYPLQNIWLYPGLSNGYYIRVIGTSYMTEYENITDPYIDPPEYFSALYLTLALRMAPKYGIEAQQGTILQAKSAIKYIKSQLFLNEMNAPMVNGLISTQSGFNILAGM